MSPALSLRKENEYIAKLAQQAEHCKEMVEYMENVAKTIESEGSTTSSLLRRASSWIISSIKKEEESCGNEDHVARL
ncbi:hypothetical protein AAC387_Pa03g3009 [Persea americana]